MSQIQKSRSDGVTRLKELLFDNESQALIDLARRIEVLAESGIADRQRLHDELKSLSETERRERLGMLDRVDKMFDRVGTADKLEASVADVIDGSIRKAEAERHEPLASAISPLVVRTVKTEIRNSRDELVEALYPMTGRMVKAYVASAMKDLMEQINKKLEQNPFMLRLASLTTGRSVAELALADSQRTSVEELYLIRRGAGELIAHWPGNVPGSNRDQIVSGVLTALTEFATEAFSDDGRSLRQFDLGSSQVYLRLSPLYLLAVRCTGSAHAAIEQVIDDEFLSSLERHAGIAASHPPGAVPKSVNDELLNGLSDNLKAKISEAEEKFAPPRAGTALLKSLVWIVGLPLLMWLAWSVFTNYETARVRKIATDVVASNEDLRGYPTHLVVEPRGRSITLSGLAPLPSARDKVIADLKAALPLSDVRDQMAVVPSGLANAEPLIRAVKKDLVDLERESGRSAALIATDRGIRALDGLGVPLDRIRKDLPAGKTLPIDSASTIVAQAKKRLAGLRAQILASTNVSSDLAGLVAETRAIDDMLAAATADLSALLPEAARLPPIADVTTGPGNVGILLPNADRLAGEAERLAATVAALGQTTVLKSTEQGLESEIAALRAKIAALESRPLPAPPPAVPQPTPRERLEAWARAHAIFFGNGLEFRDGERAGKKLDELAALILASDSLVRIVGYTDEIGVAARNSTLSLTRAETVLAALAQRGVPANRLIALGRQNAIDIAPTKGTQSSNRRVEFEVGFIGENGP